MTWRCNERANARNYPTAAERRAFVAAYSDGYHGLPMWAAYCGRNNCEWPNAYGAGYHDGVGDREENTNARV